MWLIFVKRGHVVLSPGYCRYWDSRQAAATWAEENGYQPHEIEVIPCVWELYESSANTGS